MKWLSWAAAAALVIGGSTTAFASPYKEDEEEEGHIDAPTYRLMTGDENAVAGHLQRDLMYVDEMSEHDRIGLDPQLFGTHSLRRTKATLIYRRTGNLRAVQLLLGHTKIESTVRYLGIEVDDALTFAEQVDV
jgi:integrase